MRYTYLGRTGLRVSRLCLGTMNWGPQTDEKDAYAIMDAALEAGVNYFDTANVYGHRGPAPMHRGWTEEIIGRWFALGGGRRESVVLATKVYGEMGDAADGPNDDAGVSAFKIRRQVEGSLRRLQTDHIEIYQMHHITRHAPWDEIWGAYEALIAQGKIYYAGSSNFAARHLCYAQFEAQKRHFLGLVSEQHKYSLLTREPELEVLPAASDLGIGVICWSPLAGGLLGGHALDASEGRSARSARELTPAQRSQIQAFHTLAAGLGESPANVALAWLLAQPGITAPIIGPRTLAHFTESLRAVDIVLDDTTLARLDEIFPGPGGSAPEAYSW
jgi:aryl-alcohol dehydrogenase-like predicted oxidoreductase